MKNKIKVAIVAIILMIVATFVFVVIKPHTGNILAAYIFTLIGVLSLWGGMIYILSKPKIYQFTVVYVIDALKYLALQIGFSVVVIAAQFMTDKYLDTPIFVLLQIILLAVFTIKVTVMVAGVEHIESTDENIRAKTDFINKLQQELEVLRGNVKNDDLKKDLTSLIEAVRYSDPVSCGEAVEIEMKISNKIKLLNDILLNEDFTRGKDTIIDIKMLVGNRNRICKASK